MKKISISKLILGFALLFVGFSCEDFLESEPKSFLSPSNFYKNKAQSEAALYSVYDALTLSGLYKGYHDQISIGDLAGNGFKSDGALYDAHTVEASEGIITNLWNSSYIGISRANSVLDYVPGADIVDEDKNAILGEARFLRALFYSHMVEIFGAIPLHITAVSSLENVVMPRSSVEEVYDLIVKDLQQAGNDLPVSPSASGRATKGAAKTLLARIYLTLGEFQLARDLALEVMNLGVYDLWENYEDVFMVANENGKESIFEVQFKSNAGSQGNSKSFVLPSSLGDIVENGPTFRDYYVTPEMVGLYEAGDQRKTINAAEELEVNGETIEFQEPVSLKYLDESFSVNIEDSNNNYIVMRYAEALLIFAEAENEVSGPSTAALGAINKVRRRAFGLDINSSSSFDLSPSLSKEEFRQVVWDERFLELALEGRHWFDLKRTNRLLSVENLQEHQLVYPIPQRELDVNLNLEQNPGYN